MNILEEIVAKRKATIKELKSIMPQDAWEMLPGFDKKTISLKKQLSNGTTCGIIAEFKKASPSKGVINQNADVFDVVFDYNLHGAAGVSILTEPYFFNGNNDDLLRASEVATCPILRKDFIIDEYQITESKALGADVILLIAACLTPMQVKQLASFAKQLKLEVLLELHEEAELEHVCSEIDMVGINNRNLKTFEVDIENSLRLAQKIPKTFVKIAESGIDKIETINLFKANGYKGFLIGEMFMKEKKPGNAFKLFTEKLL